MNRHESPNGGAGLLSRYGLALAVFIAVAGYFLWAEHEAHVKLAIPYLPYLILLLCPLMHLLMHRGHGHGGRGKPPHGDGDRP